MLWSALIIIIRRNAAQKRDLHPHMHTHTHVYTYSSWAIELTRCTSGLPESQSKLGSGSQSATSAALQLIAPFQRKHTRTHTHTHTHIHLRTHRAIQIKTGKTTRKINFCFSKPMPPSPFPLSLARLPSDIGKLIYWSIIFYLLFKCRAGRRWSCVCGVWLLLEAYAFDSCFWIWRPFIVFVVVVASVILLRERDSKSVNWSCESEADKHHKVIKWKTIMCLLTGSIENLTNFMLILLKYTGNIVK